MQARGKARNGLAGLRQLLEPVVDVQKHLPDVLKAVAGVFPPQGKDLFLRRLEHILRRACAVIDHLADLSGGGSQIAHERLVVDDGAVLLDVGGRRRDLKKLGNVIVGMRLVIDAALLHLVEHRHRVDLFREIEHRIDGLVDLAVLPQIEVLRPKKADDVRHTALVNEHGAEHRLLRLQ